MPPLTPIKGFKPRAVQSPSALRADRDCRASWGYSNLQGRRLEVPAFEDLPPAPPAAPKGASAVEKKRATLALKAWNKPMRLALGTAVHAVFEQYYLQKVSGAWHPPMARVDLSPLWHTRPGQIALAGRAHMPAPEVLAEVRCEQFVSIRAVPGWPALKPWPNIGGTPDLVTRERHALCVGDMGPWVWHLYDYKTTVDFQYAKTPAELLNDEQAVLYSLAVMQEHGLTEIACTWLYVKTVGAVSQVVPVHFTMPRAHAEARAVKMAERALVLEAITREYISAPKGFLGDERRLAVLASLPTNDGHCSSYGGCPFHAKQGGPCRPKKSPLGTTLRRSAEHQKQITGRKQAAKESRDIMAETFKEKQARMKAEREGGGAAASAPAPAEVETTGEDATAAASEPAPAKPAKVAAPKAADGDEITPAALARAFAGLPKTSPIYKGLLKVVKIEAALEAARAGE